MELASELFGVFLMRLEQGQAFLWRRFQLWILVSGISVPLLLTVCDTPPSCDIGLVERGYVEGGKLVTRGIGLLGQGLLIGLSSGVTLSFKSSASA